METVEIRMNHRKLVPMLLLMSGAMFFVAFFIFTPKLANESLSVKVISIGFFLWFFFRVYILLNKLVNNKAILTFTKYELIVSDKRKESSYLWGQVFSWEVEKDDTNYYLILHTEQGKRQIDISWLKVRPDQVDELMKRYKG